MNEGCCDVLLTLTYIDGQGCDPCAVDTLVTTDVTLTVRANTVVDLPKGFVQGITGLAVDGAGAAKVVTANQDISYNACLEPCCSGSVVAV